MWEGRVEIFLSGVWGSVSHNGAYDAKVVCRQLGYNTYSRFIKRRGVPVLVCPAHAQIVIILLRMRLL